MFRRLAVALGGTLILFHAGLLASQGWHGELREPAVALRWLVAAGLGVALGHVHRHGGAMFWGRRAGAIWLLAAMLHGPGLTGSGLLHQTQALPEAVTVVVQIAAASVIAGLGLVLLAAGVRPRASAPLRTANVRAGSRFRAFCVARVMPFAPRPPPRLFPSLI